MKSSVYGSESQPLQFIENIPVRVKTRSVKPLTNPRRDRGPNLGVVREGDVNLLVRHRLKGNHGQPLYRDRFGRDRHTVKGTEFSWRLTSWKRDLHGRTEHAERTVSGCKDPVKTLRVLSLITVHPQEESVGTLGRLLSETLWRSQTWRFLSSRRWLVRDSRTRNGECGPGPLSLLALSETVTPSTRIIPSVSRIDVLLHDSRRILRTLHQVLTDPELLTDP